ncbi:hypothetical protein [Allohahella sp. A8]|uniref:hypothetical protein n=1 Tax=Allohahella sp. A8 TaxID=3141461 RepID=UPI003A8108A1
MTPYALDEAHRLRCLAALGIDGSVLRADLYVGRRRGAQSRPADAAVNRPTPSSSIAAVRQAIVADAPSEQVAVVAARSKPALKTESVPASKPVHQPALESFTVVTSHTTGPHWFAVLSGESKESGYKSQRALFMSICGQFGIGGEPAGDSAREYEPGLTTVFGWPPLKPSVLGLLGNTDPFVMYQRCITERVAEIWAEQRLSTDAPLRPALLFTAELVGPETVASDGVGALGSDEHSLVWREILDMPEETLRSADRLIGQVGSRVILLPPLRTLLLDAGLRRDVQTVLLLLTRRSGPLRN